MNRHEIAVEAWKQITDYADNCEDGIQDMQGDTVCIGIIESVIEKDHKDAEIYRYFKKVAKEEYGSDSLGEIFVWAGEHLRAARATPGPPGQAEP